MEDDEKKYNGGNPDQSYIVLIIFVEVFTNNKEEINEVENSNYCPEY